MKYIWEKLRCCFTHRKWWNLHPTVSAAHWDVNLQVSTNALCLRRFEWENGLLPGRFLKKNSKKKKSCHAASAATARLLYVDQQRHLSEHCFRRDLQFGEWIMQVRAITLITPRNKTQLLLSCMTSWTQFRRMLLSLYLQLSWFFFCFHMRNDYSMRFSGLKRKYKND